jgi:hypothetical protein
MSLPKEAILGERAMVKVGGGTLVDERWEGSEVMTYGVRSGG